MKTTRTVLLRKLARNRGSLIGQGVYAGTSVGDSSGTLNPVSVTRTQIAIGARLRVIIARWDRPVGTVATVTATGTWFVGDVWWFAVDWLNHLPGYPSRSLRMWEEDLPTFEIITGPVVIPAPPARARQTKDRRLLPLQSSLPFTKADDHE